MDYKKEIIQMLDSVNNEYDLMNIYKTTALASDIQTNKYNVWFASRTAEVYDLTIRVLMLERYFDDMMLDKKSIMEKYTKMPFNDFSDDTNNGTDSLSLMGQHYRFEISTNIQNDYDGYNDQSEKLIVINKSVINNDNVILHEMLHAHEQILLSINHIVRDALILELYKKLKNQVKNLDAIIDFHANINHNIRLSELGGEHSLLFLLKSLEIDLRCNNELFTVFGYDYNRNFKELNLI